MNRQRFVPRFHCFQMAFFHSRQRPTGAKYTCEFVLAYCKKSAARSQNSTTLQGQILQTCKMPPDIDQRNLAAFFTVHYVLPLRS